jgi:putative endonuclease
VFEALIVLHVIPECLYRESRNKIVTKDWIPAFTGMINKKPESRNGIFMSYDKHYFVYILASKRNGTLYIGVTNNLIKRVYEHKNDLVEGFTKKYKVHHLVYYEMTNDVKSAIEREKRLKKWNRKWKLELIEKMNPQWKDLYDGLVQ